MQTIFIYKNGMSDRYERMQLTKINIRGKNEVYN